VFVPLKGEGAALLQKEHPLLRFRKGGRGNQKKRVQKRTLSPSQDCAAYRTEKKSISARTRKMQKKAERKKETLAMGTGDRRKGFSLPWQKVDELAGQGEKKGPESDQWGGGESGLRGKRARHMTRRSGRGEEEKQHLF